ncbi:hypothetical protein MBLNU230_g6956t1 [Neophaeotheca triangularis]
MPPPLFRHDTLGETMLNGFPLTDASQGAITCWLLDTRKLWPGDNIYAAGDAAACLAHISMPEQNVVTTKMFIQDARMSLGSALLKRSYISKTLGIPWQDVNIAKKGGSKHGKPCAVDANGKPIEGIDFNVSHQAGLVTLIGWDRRRHSTRFASGPFANAATVHDRGEKNVTVGTDIVCVNERDDYRTIDEEGLDGWIELYESIFSHEERWSMKFDVDRITMLDGSILEHADIGRLDRCIARNRDVCANTRDGKAVEFNSDRIIEAKLRRFYTYFCYKESYIKLAGEGLIAPWLCELSFHNVRSPTPGTVARCSTLGSWGEEVDDVEVQLYGKTVRDVKMKIQAFEEDIMISTAIQGDVEGVVVPAFKTLDLTKDVLPQADNDIKHYKGGVSAG